MKKLKLDKNLSTRLSALCIAGVLAVTFTSCGKKKTQNKEINVKPITTATPDYSKEKTMVVTTTNNIEKVLPDLNEEIEKNTSIILLLDILAKEDENGKIHADIISKMKSKIDSDKMMDDFNSFLDEVESTTIKTDKLVRVSGILPEDMKNDKEILSRIENILDNIIKFSKENNKDAVAKEFDKIYDLFVNENEIEIDKLKFSIRDLTFGSREIANTYAETAIKYVDGIVNKDKITAVDNRTNDQNSKAYIKSKLDILNNEIQEKSEADVIKLFNNTYKKANDLSKNKVTITDNEIKDLVNILNMKYLDSDKVATKDKKEVLGEYDEKRINDALISIDAINTYNQKNQKNIIPYSELLVDNYTKTDSGNVDKLALNFVQFNSMKLLSTTNEKTTYDELLLNPYYNNLHKYITKQNLTHITLDKKGNIENNNITWQQISDGVNFVNYEIILDTFNKLSNIKEVSMKDGIIDKAKKDLSETILYIQNTITGECQKVNTENYIKIKK